jgi:hypothetical protein
MALSEPRQLVRDRANIKGGVRGSQLLVCVHFREP